MATWNVIAYTDIRPDRFDAEYFSKSYRDNVATLKMTGDVVSFDKLFHSICRGGQPDYNSKGTIPVLRSVNVGYMSFNTTRQEYVTKTFYAKMQKGQVYKDDVLVTSTGVGTLGRTSIWYSNKNAFCDGHISILRGHIVNPYFVTVFLNSKYGILQFDQNFRGSSGQIEIYPYDLSRFLIPAFLFKYQYEIGDYLVKAFELQEQSQSLYHQAEELLNKELQLDKLQLSHKKCYTANFSEVVSDRRVDAEFYQPKYADIENRIKSYKNGYSYIKDHFFESSDTCIFDKKEYKYIEIGDITIGDGSTTFNIIKKEDLPISAKYQIKKGDILISTVRPYRGAVTIVNFDDTDILGSSAFTILREKGTFKKEVAMVLLRLNCYKNLLMKWNVGTSYPVIKNSDVTNLVIPLIPNDLQIKISDLIKNSMQAKNNSTALLAKAKHRVEELIEQEANKK